MLSHNYPARRSFYQIGQEASEHDIQQRLIALQEENVRTQSEHLRQMRYLALVGAVVGVGGLLVSIAALSRRG